MDDVKLAYLTTETSSFSDVSVDAKDWQKVISVESGYDRLFLRITSREQVTPWSEVQYTVKYINPSQIIEFQYADNH